MTAVRILTTCLQVAMVAGLANLINYVTMGDDETDD